MSLAARARSIARRGAASAWRYGTRRDPQRLQRRLKAHPSWQTSVEGAAPRLSHSERIEVTQIGRFRQIDPYHTVEGWRDPWKIVGFVGWTAAVGVAWWVGSSRGRGPLAILAEDHERAF